MAIDSPQYHRLHLLSKTNSQQTAALVAKLLDNNKY